MKTKYWATLKQNKGKRETQQDTGIFLSYEDQDNLAHILIVADGVGSLDRGGSASAFLVQSLVRWFDETKKELFTIETDDIERMLIDEIAEIDNLLKRRTDEEDMSYGTTLTLVLIINFKCILLQVGDTRAYMFSKEKLTLLSKDQTRYQLYLDQGLEIPKGKEKEYRAMITQCIGNGRKVSPKVSSRVLPLEYDLLICSDGFYQKLDESDIKAMFMSTRDDNEILDLTVEHLLSIGESDNITAILFRNRVEA